MCRVDGIGGAVHVPCVFVQIERCLRSLDMLTTDVAVLNGVEQNATCESPSTSDLLDTKAEITARAKATFERMSPGWKALYKRVQTRDLGHGVK